jgi:hypothetical protein
MLTIALKNSFKKRSVIEIYVMISIDQRKRKIIHHYKREKTFLFLETFIAFLKNNLSKTLFKK